MVGPSALHLDLSLGTWAADGLLAIFFFVVGLELKREFVAGDLRDPRRAAVPIIAAVGGVALPAIIYLAVNLERRRWRVRWLGHPDRHGHRLRPGGSRHHQHPSCRRRLRTFLLTLAIVDDLLAITIIAFFFTDDLEIGWLLVALVPIAAFAHSCRSE